MRLGLLIMPFLIVVAIWGLLRAGYGGGLLQLSENMRLLATHGFAWGFLAAGIGAVLLMPFAAALLSSTRIGGPDAKQPLSEFDAVAVGFAATTSLGLLYWGAAEPVFHFHDPADGLGRTALTREASVMARSATMMHWAVLAHALAGVFMIGFGVAVQTVGRAESLDGVILSANPGERRWTAALLDGPVFICATLMLVAGLASALIALPPHFGTAAALLGGDIVLLALLGALMLLVLFAGGRRIGTTYAALARWSLVALLVFLLVLIVIGPTREILVGGAKSIGWMFRYCRSLLLYGFAEHRDLWAETWTVTHLAGWVLIAPLTGFFLSRAARGYTVDEAVLYFVALPALVSMLCVAVLGGLTLGVERAQQGGVWRQMQAEGPGAAIYHALRALPQPRLWIVVFTILLSLSLVTFLAAALGTMMRICAPGFDHSPNVIGNRRAVMLIWCLAMAGCAWLVAVFGLGAMIEATARFGALFGLIASLLAVLAVLRLSLLPSRALKRRHSETVDLRVYEKEESFKIDPLDEEAHRRAIMTGKPGGKA